MTSNVYKKQFDIVNKFNKTNTLIIHKNSFGTEEKTNIDTLKQRRNTNVNS